MPGSHLTVSERVKLETLLPFGLSVTGLAAELGRSKSTISRELRRHAGLLGRYKAVNAQMSYERRREACRPVMKLSCDPLRAEVEAGLREEWSPEQISERLVLLFPDDSDMRVSHETIYQHVYADKRTGGLLHQGLRQGRKKRRNRSHTKGRRGLIKDRVLIHERPEIVNTQARIGDWEGDTVIGKNHQGAVATFVDRKSLYLVAAPMPNKTPGELNKAALAAFKDIPAQHRHTLTLDNGLEFAHFKLIQSALNLAVYFAEPYRSCQRAINENTNGLLRQYLPKKTDFTTLTPVQLKSYVDKLNNRPRKKLGYRTPSEVFHERAVAVRS